MINQGSSPEEPAQESCPRFLSFGQFVNIQPLPKVLRVLYNDVATALLGSHLRR